MNEKKERKKYQYSAPRDQGDKWKDIERKIESLHPACQQFFKELNQKVQAYNRTFDKNFQIFESSRAVSRQKRLVQQGVSWVANAEKAPHVQGRAVDYAEFKYSEKYRRKIWVWNHQDLKKLREWIEQNWEYATLLRSKIKNDYPHYELKRFLFKKWSEIK